MIERKAFKNIKNNNYRSKDLEGLKFYLEMSNVISQCRDDPGVATKTFPLSHFL
jgi:hypothetical protein